MKTSETKRAYQKAYRAANRDVLLVKQRARFAAKRTENNARSRAYYAANVERARSYSAQYRAEHVEEMRAYAAHYRATRPRVYTARGKAANLNRKNLGLAYVASLKAGPCSDCGLRFPSECMDFDHVRGTKRRAISRILTASRVVLDTEIAKCDLVCANCHRIRTMNRRLQVAN